MLGPHAYIYGVSGEEAEPLLIMDGLMEGSRERERRVLYARNITSSNWLMACLLLNLVCNISQTTKTMC